MGDDPYCANRFARNVKRRQKRLFNRGATRAKYG